MFKKVIEFIASGSIFISVCAVALCIETRLLLHLPLNSFSFYLFIFSATLLQYNIHYLFRITAPASSVQLLWSIKRRNNYKILIAFGIISIIYSLLSFRIHHLFILSAFGIIAFLYSFPLLPFANKKRIKDFGLGKIFTLAILWTLVTVWFPVADENIFNFSFQLIFFRRFIFIFILCLLFDIRDIETDKKENIATLAVKLGIKRAYALCNQLLVLFIALSIIDFIYLGDYLQLSAMLISAAVTFITIQFSKKNNSDLVYLLCIDGMMILQALLVIFVSNIN